MFASGRRRTPDAGYALDPPPLGGSLRLDDEGLLVLDSTPGAGVDVWDVEGDAVVATYPSSSGST